MSILLFAGLLASVVTLITVVFLCLSAEFGRAWQTANRWSICDGALVDVSAVSAEADPFLNNPFQTVRAVFPHTA